MESNERFENTWDEVTLNIKVTIKKHFAPEFVAMLQRMQENGQQGHSEWVAIYSDGDGAMRPKFTITGPDDVMQAAAQPRVKWRQIHANGYDAG